MTEIQQALLQQLQEFDRFCDENNIRYSVHGGTLLGAVRENGFIPWDNDIDVSMTRKEYEKFRRLFTDNSEKYALIEGFTGGAMQFIKKVDGSVFDAADTASTDIFIYDYISENKLAQKVKIIGIIIMQAMLKNKETIKLTTVKEHGVIKTAIYKLTYLFGRLISLERKRKWYENFSKNKLVGSRKYIFLSNDSAKSLHKIIPTSYMNEFVNLTFEGISVSANLQHKEVLAVAYGDDYMTPKYNGTINERHERFRNILFEDDSTRSSKQ